MSSTLTATLLGTGTSTGIPIIGCDCSVCTSDDPRDQRTRCACIIEVDGLKLLIDAGPDFRMQALREGIDQIDAVLFTHHHFDHVVGLDDLRPFLFRNRRPIPCFAPPDTAAVLRSMFSYIFDDGSYPGVPNLTLHETNGPFSVTGREDPSKRVLVTPIPVMHGEMAMSGYRVGHFAYLTDTNQIPESSLPLLGDLDVLVLDALRHAPHPTHFTIAEAVAAAGSIGAAETWFVHMTHSVMHAPEDEALPPGIHLGYDGLRLEARSG